MQELNDRIQAFAAEHSLECVDGLYAGRYEDMYITLRAEEETALRVMVCLNLPRGGRRKALEEALAEKLARYGAKPAETAFANALAFRFYGNDPLDDMRRFLAEADPLLRPYGREMGVLCALPPGIRGGGDVHAFGDRRRARARVRGMRGNRTGEARREPLHDSQEARAKGRCGRPSRSAGRGGRVGADGVSWHFILLPSCRAHSPAGKPDL